METILKQEERPVIDEMVEFLRSLSPEEQKEINNFIEGVKFAKKLGGEKESA